VAEVDLLKTFVGIGDTSAIGSVLEIQSLAIEFQKLADSLFLA